MTDDLYSLLASVGFRKRGSDVQRTAGILAGWEPTKIGDLCLEISERLPRPTRIPKSPFSFMGNSSLGGDWLPCSAPYCRLNAVESMARFTALYADAVILPDQFEILHDGIETISHEAIGTKSHDRYCLEMAVHLHVLQYLRPLIDYGLITFGRTAHRRLCMSCYAKALGESSIEYLNKLTASLRFLEARYQKEIAYKVINFDGDIDIEQTGPEDLVPHASAIIKLWEAPKSIMAKRDQVPFKLTARQAKACGMGHGEVTHILDDLLRQNFYGNTVGVSYLTQRDIDLALLRQLEPNARKAKVSRGPTTPTAFSHALPVIDQIDVTKILALRKAEGAAFAVYREALVKGLNQKDLTLSQQMEFFRDVIQPEIAKSNSP